MKVKIQYTVDVTDEQRKALSYGMTGELGSMCSHADIAHFFKTEGSKAVISMKEYYEALAEQYRQKADERY